MLISIYKDWQIINNDASTYEDIYIFYSILMML